MGGVVGCGGNIGGVLNGASPSFLGCCISDAEGAGGWRKLAGETRVVSGGAPGWISDCTHSMVVVPSVFVGGFGFLCGAAPTLCEDLVLPFFPAS